MRRALIFATFAVACAAPRPRSASTSGGFSEDLAFLSKHTSAIVLEHPEGGRVAVTPALQGRVMTSAVAPDAPGLGFVHRKFFDEKRTGTAFDNYGGEDRFWLGPEGTRHSLYFAKGAPLTFEHWQTPRDFNEGAFAVVDQSATRVAMRRSMRVESHSGFVFELGVERVVDLIDRAAAAQLLGVAVPASVRFVAFSSTNTITNTGAAPWARDTGLVNVWILGMYAPSSDATALIPFRKDAEGPIVRDDYFGKVPADRLVVHDGFLSLRCDGEHRSKIGVPPARAKSVLGSYSSAAELLTIVQYDGPKPGVYPSGVWDEAADPYAGDAINAYNDGPVSPGKPSLGGFYELETTSPGAELPPGGKLTHVHRTFHFVGPRAALDAISTAVLGVALP